MLTIRTTNKTTHYISTRPVEQVLESRLRNSRDKIIGFSYTKQSKA